MGTLRVGLCQPDPPFNGMSGSTERGGLDIDVISAIAENLGTAVEFVDHTEGDVERIFGGLDTGAYDCVIAGTTVTPQRQRLAAFAPPYLITGQALAVDVNRLPQVRSVEDLGGLTLGVLRGGTGRSVADQIVARDVAAQVREYDRATMPDALTGPGGGGCDAVIELAPVLAELIKPLTGVEVIQRGLTTEDIAIAVARTDTELLARITAAQGELEDDGTLQGIRRRWLGNPFTDQSLAAL